MQTYKTLFIGDFTQDNVNPPCGAHDSEIVRKI